jgi:riboflavin synthase
VTIDLFTGLVEEVGTIVQVHQVGQGRRFVVSATLVAQGIELGDSVAVNGVCLTVVQYTGANFAVDVVPETIRHSSLSDLHQGAFVNLERAMRADARFGGHIVAGHVDGVGYIEHIVNEDNAIVLTVKTDATLLRYIIAKGSIAIDGISLTVMDAGRSSFRVSIIPHTAAQTTLHKSHVGTKVNLEVDQMGKYAEKLLGNPSGLQSDSGITQEKLRKWGY